MAGTTAALVSTEWLASQLRAGVRALRVLDATFHLPTSGRDASAEHILGPRVPGSGFFDIEGISDPMSPLPHMLPDSASFAAAMRSLGVCRGEHVVVYDTHGVQTSPRAWWMFRVFGHDAVSVLDGGLPRWRSQGHEVGMGPVDRPPSGDFADRGLRSNLVCSHAEMLKIVAQQHCGPPSLAILDARPAGRFAGHEPEPRPGLARGHMPGAYNVPAGSLVDQDTKLFCPKGDLLSLFSAAGVPATGPYVTTCGSGVTACTAALALWQMGRPDVVVYDGSWAQWGADPSTPKSTMAKS